MLNTVSMRIFGLITLLTFLSGCSGYRHYQFPVETDSQEIAISQKIIEAGTMVRVTMKTGEINEGVLQEIQPDLVEIMSLEGEGTIQTYSVQDVLKLEYYFEVSPLVELGVASLAVGTFALGYFLINYDGPNFSPDEAK